MARACLVRRTTALVGATALVSVAGLASGALVGVANAQTATSVSPSAVSNASTSATAFTVNGVGFVPLTASVSLVPTKAGDEVGSIAATVDTVNSSATALKVTAPLTMVAPEPYDVVVAQPGSPASTCHGCLTVTNPGRPTVTGVVKDTGAGFMTISGTNFAVGAKVSFLKPDLSVDPSMTFAAGRDGLDPTGQPTHTAGYVSTTTLKGHYAPGPNPAAGRHLLKVTNLDGQGSAQYVEFWQPIYGSTVPSALGQGANDVPVTVRGDGIRSGSVLTITQFSSSQSDLAVGPSTVAADNKSITAPVSVDTNGGASGREVVVFGPDGGYSGTGNLSITAGPNPSGGLDVTSFGQGAKLVPATITGTGFQQGIVFGASGGGISIATQTVSLDGQTATVTVTVAPDAPVGGRTTLTATNPDHGVGTQFGDGTPLGSPFPLTVDAAPVLTSTSPSATTAPQTGKQVTLTGTGFDASNGMTVSFGSGITTTDVSVLSATSAVATVDVAAGTTAGPRDVVLTNNGDKGSSTCLQCFGIDSLSVAPAAAANTSNSVDLTFTASASSSLTGATTVVLRKTGSPSYQPDITGQIHPTPTATSATATFDLTNAAPGLYNVVVTAPGGPLSCTGCFTITGTDFTVTGVTPATGGQGATDFRISLHGTGFVRGETVTIPGTTVSGVTFVDATTLQAKITIPADATPGQVDVTVSSADGAFTHTITNGYTIVAGPTVTSASTPASNHKNLGQGAVNKQVSIVGSGFTAGARVSFSGEDVTATTVFIDATHLTATVTVGGTAATGDRDVVVLNTDNGGTGSKAGLVTVTARPVPSLVSPTSLVAGKSTQLTISGQGFQSDATPVIAGVTFSGTALDSNGALTATATAASNAVPGARAVTVTNTDGGTGTCSCSFTVVIPTTLTSALASKAVSGGLVTPSGRLTNSNTGGAVAGARLVLTFSTAVRAPVTRYATTNASGGWSYPFRPVYTTKVAVSYPGDSSHLASAAPSPTVGVAPRITVTSPKYGSSSRASTVLAIKGTTSPNKAGRLIYLYRTVNGHLQSYGRARVASNGTFAFSLKPGRGTYYFRVGIGATPGNIGGYSARLQVKRT
ncbi:MAG: hypothetical protein JWM02_1033 [Frankiales bacterium]|nr:hypothetical protein [Frankiales bacterium]